jgi:hypothetical protein
MYNPANNIECFLASTNNTSINIPVYLNNLIEAFTLISHNLSSAFSDMLTIASMEGLAAAFDTRMSMCPYFCKDPEKRLLLL